MNGAFLLAAWLVVSCSSCDRWTNRESTSSARATGEQSARSGPQHGRSEAPSLSAPSLTAGPSHADGATLTAGPTQAGGPAGPVPELTIRDTPTAPSVSYFADATSIVPKLQEKIGLPLRALKVNIYSSYVLSEIQDPKNKLELRRCSLRDGRLVVTPDRGQLIGAPKTEADLAKMTFDLAEVDWTVIPRVVADATARVKVEAPAVSHVHIGRPLRQDRPVEIRVFVSGAKETSGFTDYDVKGQLKKVHSK